LVKCFEGVLSVRLPKPLLRRYLSGDRNEILQTIIPDTANIRNKDIKFSLDWNWTLALSIYAGISHHQLIERWQFSYCETERATTEDQYQQASTALRSILSLSLILPAYSKFKEGWKLDYAIGGEADWGNQQKTRSRLKMFECSAGTLFLEVHYATKIELLSPGKLLRLPSLRNLEAHPLSELGLVTLSESESSQDESDLFHSIKEEDTHQLSKELRTLIEATTVEKPKSLSPSPSNRTSLGVYAVVRTDPVTEQLEHMLSSLPDVLQERSLKEEYFDLLALKVRMEQKDSVQSPYPL
jgi:hypothetical protein